MSQTNTDRLREDFQRVMGDAEMLFRETANKAGDRLRETNDQAVSYVRRRPWQSLGVALMAGTLLGMLMSRRSR